jgi:U4/U6.U5 tri-snRNP component SNU23
MSQPPKKFETVDNIGRKKWDLNEFKEQAKLKEQEEANRSADKNGQGKQLVVRNALQARNYTIDLYEKVGKHTVVTGNSALKKRGGFYCDVCDCLLKDSITYMDHINGKNHQKAMGMSMHVERSTVSQVKQRLQDIKQKQEEKKDVESIEERMARYEQEQRDKKKRKKLHQGNSEDQDIKRTRSIDADNADALSSSGTTGSTNTSGNEQIKITAGGEEEDPEMAAMKAMGFSAGFGSSKKK